MSMLESFIAPSSQGPESNTRSELIIIL